MSIAIKRIERAISDLPKGGMQTGGHKVKLDLADAERLIIELNALQDERDAYRKLADSMSSLMVKRKGTFTDKELKGAQNHLAAHDAEVAKAAVLSTLRTYGDTDLSHAEIFALAENYAASLSK